MNQCSNSQILINNGFSNTENKRVNVEAKFGSSEHEKQA